ncbi:Uncharacterized protein FWK35_00033963 [Aphis craccivora]|uniref:Uncharacterized protein n=1 Tax=Aphis craccivora TaxID=307492 RepID=A0A6G0ZGE7_APHCR|nr:Uncharacterized protein FWK35_00033963 [Aphis craccivora]
MIINAPFYVSIYTRLHTDLLIKTIFEMFSIIYKRNCLQLVNHSNPLILILDSISIPVNPQRKLKKISCRDDLNNS